MTHVCVIFVSAWWSKRSSNLFNAKGDISQVALFFVIVAIIIDIFVVCKIKNKVTLL